MDYKITIKLPTETILDRQQAIAAELFKVTRAIRALRALNIVVTTNKDKLKAA